jgi:ketosteroid isomerase-like protein
MTDAVAVVLAFNEAINRRDLAALTELMTETHRFIDTEGVTVDGRK